LVISFVENIHEHLNPLPRTGPGPDRPRNHPAPSDLNQRNDDGEEYRSAGVIFLGSIPIAFGGRSRWAILGIAVIVMIFLFVVAALAQPEILGLLT
jgi:uncharacterized membrane protein